MTVEEVVKAVEDVKARKGDDESAHGAEDSLYQSLLESIALGTCEDPETCALEAIKAADIDFARWCA